MNDHNSNEPKAESKRKKEKKRKRVDNENEANKIKNEKKSLDCALNDTKGSQCRRRQAESRRNRNAKTYGLPIRRKEKKVMKLSEMNAKWPLI